MTPLAICLDKLQAEDNAYMGCLHPYLMVMKDAFVKMKQDDKNRQRRANNLVDYPPGSGHLPTGGTKGVSEKV